MEQKFPVKKVSLICAKGSIEDVYCTPYNGERCCNGRDRNQPFFHLFRNGCNNKKRMDKLHTGIVGNPALRLPGGMRCPHF